MKKPFLAFTISLFLALAPIVGQTAANRPVPAPTPTNAEFTVPFVNKTLPNGLEVIVLQDQSVPLVTVELAVRNGSFTEPPELNGLSHLYEHMFFKTNNAVLLAQCEPFILRGGRNPICDEPMRLRSQIGSVAYVRDLDKAGYVRNGTTHEEYVNYFFSTTSEHLEMIMRYMRDATLFPSFIEEELRQEIQVVLGELDRNLSEPFYYLDRTLMDNLFYKYPTRKSPGGTRETVAAATTEKMRLIQSRYYIPNNSALIVTGDVQPERVFKLAEELFGIWQKGEDPFIKFPMVEHPPLEKSKGIIVEQDVENVVVQIGWHGPSIGKDDAGTYAADVFSFIMEQPNSKLQRALIDSGLAVGLSVHYYTQRNTGPIRITLVTSPDRAKAALAELYKQIALFDSPGYYSDEELSNAKNLLEAEDLYRREKLSEYTHALGFWWSSTGVDYYRGYHRALRAVSRADVSKYLNTYIIGKPHVSVAMLSPDAKAAAKLTEADLIGK
ncbi:M16 family metallopeptidase [Leptolyngbya sp. 7M]|uniref:M16 family metallopeptidase n=1 Tax=Leptolyngbya sp. 7M TaxID=2812896 RepID=UPI001B8D8D4F|nr:pitrilysin family protein [Leptolyngbya sp. 7M]QYO67288.1 insulinase family protein [Leptolyngbya sp. 7M]